MSEGPHYEFREEWIIPEFSPKEVYDVISDAKLLPVWWKGVYLSSIPLDGDEARIGARTRVTAKGFLPYKLNFVLEATALHPHSLVETVAEGDFTGTWRAEISAHGSGTKISITWITVVNKPVIKLLSPLLRPLFRMNHNWTTIRGEEGLRSFLISQRNRVGCVD